MIKRTFSSLIIKRKKNVIEAESLDRTAQLKRFMFLLNNAENEKCEAKSFWKKVRPLLNTITDQELIDGLGMQDMSRVIHVIQKKYRKIPAYRDIDHADLEIYCADTVIGRASYQSVVVHFLKIVNDELYIEGESSVPACFTENEADTWALIGREEYKTEAYPRNVDKTILGEVYEYCRSFTLKCPLVQENYPIEVSFFSKLRKIDVFYRAIVCMRFSPIATQVKNQYARMGNYLLRIEENKIQIFPYSLSLWRDFEDKYRKSLSLIKDRAAYRACRFREYYLYFRNRKQRQIWLFSDRINKADDNGEAFFSYVVKEKKEVEAYFIISNLCHDYTRLKTVGRVVRANSLKHQMLHALADFIFTSQSNGFIENPFGKGEMYYRDLQHMAKVVFLQHGVTKDDHTKHFNRFNQDFYAIVTSSGRETSAFLELPYFYKKQQIWLSGMPRLDLLYHNEQRKILIMPTWRRNLMRQEWDERLKAYVWKLTECFEKDLYTITYRNLLHSEKLKKLVERFSYQLVFIPHPLVYPYLELFEIPSYVETISFDKVSLRKIFAESNIMITDYSSVAFDFAYLKKPVIYYQFDKDDFFSGHTYKPGYFDYKKNGFGEVVQTERRLFSLIESYLENECCMKKIYRNRVDSFFDLGRGSCCERLLKKVR